MHAAGASTRGHDILSSALTLLRRVGVNVQLEPRHLALEDGKRPDAMITDRSGKVIFTDHTVINPLSLSREAKPLSHIFETAGGLKRVKYAALARAHRATFVPLVFSCHGAASMAAIKLIRLKSIQVDIPSAQRWCGTTIAAANTVVAAVACAIQRRNALIASSVASAMRARSV